MHYFFGSTFNRPKVWRCWILFLMGSNFYLGCFFLRVVNFFLWHLLMRMYCNSATYITSYSKFIKFHFYLSNCCWGSSHKRKKKKLGLRTLKTCSSLECFRPLLWSFLKLTLTNSLESLTPLIYKDFWSINIFLYTLILDAESWRLIVLSQTLREKGRFCNMLLQI